MNFEDGLARFHDLWEHPDRVSRPKPRSIDETLAERGDLTPEQLERGFDLFEGREDKRPPDALQRFADAMD